MHNNQIQAFEEPEFNSNIEIEKTNGSVEIGQ